MIVWTEEAAAELSRMLEFLADQNPALAKKLVARVPQTVRTIAMFPEAATRDAETGTFDRYVPKTRIVLTYATRGDDVVIVTGWHTSRDPETKPKRKA